LFKKGISRKKLFIEEILKNGIKVNFAKLGNKMVKTS